MWEKLVSRRACVPCSHLKAAPTYLKARTSCRMGQRPPHIAPQGRTLSDLTAASFPLPASAAPCTASPLSCLLPAPPELQGDLCCHPHPERPSRVCPGLSEILQFDFTV